MQRYLKLMPPNTAPFIGACITYAHTSLMHTHHTSLMHTSLMLRISIRPSFPKIYLFRTHLKQNLSCLLQAKREWWQLQEALLSTLHGLVQVLDVKPALFLFLFLFRISYFYSSFYFSIYFESATCIYIFISHSIIFRYFYFASPFLFRIRYSH